MEREADKEEGQEAPKRSYLKPSLVCIDLVVDEVMGLGCKDVAGSAMGSVPCDNAGCAVLGS